MQFVKCRTLRIQLIAAALAGIIIVGRPATLPAEESFPKVAAISQAVQKSIDDQEAMFVISLVATHDTILHFDATGKSEVGSPDGKDNLFWIASMTKPVTAAAVMMLVDEGKLSLDDPISKHIPEFTDTHTADSERYSITLRQCLTHTSGMADLGPEEMRGVTKLEQAAKKFASKEMLKAPGKEWRYCQSGINTAGRVVEVVSGMAFEDFLAQRIFEPLRMLDTSFYPSEEQTKRIVPSYERTPAGELVKTRIRLLLGEQSPTDRNRMPMANGGLFSTAFDYLQFCRMLLNHGELDGKRYLSEKSVQAMSSIQTGDLKTGFTPGNGWGIGCCIVRAPEGVSSTLSPGSFGHGGAYGTQAWIDPTRDRIYILLVQRSNFKNSDDSLVRRAFQVEAGKLP